MKTLRVHLVTWNGAKYVPYLFDSLKKQTYPNWELHILDNASSDNMVELMKEEIKEFPVSVTLLEQKENSGFAGGHNALFQQQCEEGDDAAPYMLLLNQDMYLEEDCFEKLVTFMEHHSDVAVVSPRMMRWDFQQVEAGEIENSFSEYVDSLGLKVLRNRRVIEQYTQERWAADSTNADIRDLYTKSFVEVFGVSGTMPLLRLQALKEIAYTDNTFLDQDYHSYKEDVDLAYRLRIAGYKAFVNFDAIAFHDRSAAGSRDLSDKTASENKKKQSSWVKYHSYKNHLMTIYKNEFWMNTLLDFIPIKWYEIKKFGYFLFFDRTPLKGLIEMVRLRKKMKQKRQTIISTRNITWKQLRVWWT